MAPAGRPQLQLSPWTNPVTSFAKTFERAVAGLGAKDRPGILRVVNAGFRHRSAGRLTSLDQLADEGVIQKVLDDPGLFEPVTEALDLSVPSLKPIVDPIRREEDPGRRRGQLEGVESRLRALLQGRDTSQGLFKELRPYIWRPERKGEYRRSWVIWEPDLFEVLVTCWRSGELPPHDHGESAAVEAVLKGTMVEETFNWSEATGLARRAHRTHGQGAVTFFESDILHSVSSPDDSRTDLVMLHIYVPPVAGAMKVYV